MLRKALSLHCWMQGAELICYVVGLLFVHTCKSILYTVQIMPLLAPKRPATVRCAYAEHNLILGPEEDSRCPAFCKDRTIA